jgi:hypothetical protein
MSDVRNDAKMALARYESSYAAFGAEACFTLKGLRDVQRYIEKLETVLRDVVVTLNSDEIPYMLRNRYACAVAEEVLENDK